MCNFPLENYLPDGGALPWLLVIEIKGYEEVGLGGGVARGEGERKKSERKENVPLYRIYLVHENCISD